MRLAAGLVLGAVSLLGACASLPGQRPPPASSTALTLWTQAGECDFTAPDRARLRAASTSQDVLPPASEGADSTFVVRGAEAHGRLLRGTYCLSVARGPASGEPVSTYGFTVTVGRRPEALQVRPVFASVRTPDGTPLRVQLALGAAPVDRGEAGAETIAAFDLGPIPGDGVALEPEAPSRNLRWPRAGGDALRLVAVVRESTDLATADPIPPDLVRAALSGDAD
ncbi:hypothetical protein [Brevundimonas lenta]|uniref:Lipoprotein n=1 Tax=Brevundimonas lenta TaxID=424796 RepID=A0A7W6JFG6_9CAUL|nr:hypothetical protein [Brevundimonas lenta]MBB4084159.1 hypothetical protein [Brevundimonas lenta]